MLIPETQQELPSSAHDNSDNKSEKERSADEVSLDELLPKKKYAQNSGPKNQEYFGDTLPTVYLPSDNYNNGANGQREGYLGGNNQQISLVG